MKAKQVCLLAIIFFLFATKMYSQKCPEGFDKKIFRDDDKVKISGCVEKKPGLLGQQVFWAVKNKTNDKLEVSFDKIINTSNGKEVRDAAFMASTTLKPGESVGGGSFFGAAGFDMTVQKETDPNKKNRIKSVGIDNIKIVNISEKEKDKETERIKQEEVKQNKLLQDQKTEKQNADAKAKQTAENTRAAKSQQATENEKAAGKKAEEDRKAATDARVAASLQASRASDAAMGSIAFGTIGLASLMKDSYTDNFAYMKFHLGLGWDNIPIITNDSKNQKSATAASSHPFLHLGFQAGFFNNKGISFHIKPFLSYGFNALSPGTTGSHLAYGSMGTLFFGKHNDSKLKLFVEGGYVSRNGDYTSDHDAAAASIGISTYSDVVETAEYNYSLIRYGGGIMLHLIDTDTETKIKPGIFFEKPSFFNNTTKPLMVGNLEILISSFLIIDVSYSKSYAISGSAMYPNKISNDNKDYFSLRLIKTGRIF